MRGGSGRGRGRDCLDWNPQLSFFQSAKEVTYCFSSMFRSLFFRSFMESTATSIASFTKFTWEFASLEHKLRRIKCTVDCGQIDKKPGQSYFPSLCGRTHKKMPSFREGYFLLLSPIHPPLAFTFFLSSFPFARASHIAVISIAFSTPSKNSRYAG